MGIELEGNPDLAGLKTTYTFDTVANRDGARVPKNLLLKALPTLIGKPIAIDHIRKYVVGYYIDYRYIEKSGTVIAYGLFFKNHFSDEWAEAKRLFKEGKLGTSHEIWCPPKYRKPLADGSYEMQTVEFAGGGLIYRNHNDKHNTNKKMDTSFRNCNVLEMAMLKMDKQDSDLVCASLGHKVKNYLKEDLIMANELVKPVEETKIDVPEASPIIDKSTEVVSEAVDIVEKPPVENVTIPTPIVPQIPEVICQNCQHVYETQEVGELSCPECKSIIDRTGKVLFPPQYIDFSFNDPEDGGSNWRLLERTDDNATVKNMESGRIYKLDFKKAESTEVLLDRMNFVYMGSANCPQCGTSHVISSPSKVGRVELACRNCHLAFHKNIAKNTKKTMLSKYVDVTEEYKTRKLEENKIQNLVVASLQVPKANDLMLNLELANLKNVNKDIIDLDMASLNIKEAKINNLGRYKKVMRKMLTKIRVLRSTLNLETASLKSANVLTIAKIQEDADKKIGFYRANATDIISRRDVLDKFGNELSDEQIMDDVSFANAKVTKENAILKASLNGNSEVISERYLLSKDSTELKSLQDEINRKAF